MTARVSVRDWLTAGLLAAGAVLFGAFIAVSPTAAVGVVVLAAAVVAAFQFPVAHLIALLLLTAVVPFTVQNVLSGGPGAGLFLSDVLLMTGLARGILLIAQRPTDPRRLLAILAMGVFLAGVVLQLAHGIASNGDLNQAGAEARALLGFGTMLVALPILADRAGRERLMGGLLVVGLALGLWGVAQWALDVGFGGTGDVGVRAGINYTTAGRGQLQGGMYGFPVAVVMSAAALVAPLALSTWQRIGVAAVLVLNTASLVLTYERTFWIATILGLGLVVLRAGPVRRLKAAGAIAAMLVVVLAAFAIVSPSSFVAAQERFASIGRYGGDASLRFRADESRHVLDRIDAQPLIGSGLGAEIFWGRPWEQVPAASTPYNHNGFLAVTWKLGAPLAALLLGLIGWCIVSRPASGQDERGRALRTGAQGALLASIVVNVTFPGLTTLAATALLGVLLALSLPDGSPARG